MQQQSFSPTNLSALFDVLNSLAHFLFGISPFSSCRLVVCSHFRIFRFWHFSAFLLLLLANSGSHIAGYLSAALHLHLKCFRLLTFCLNFGYSFGTFRFVCQFGGAVRRHRHNHCHSGSSGSPNVYLLSIPFLFIFFFSSKVYFLVVLCCPLLCGFWLCVLSARVTLIDFDYRLRLRVLVRFRLRLR